MANSTKGFTLIELMIVMSIASLLIGFVGPLAISSLEKAQAKQELLSLSNWLKKVSNRAFNSGNEYVLKFTGKQVILYKYNNEHQELVLDKTLEHLFFQPQELEYNNKGFVFPQEIKVNYNNREEIINLAYSVNLQMKQGG